MCPLRRRTGPRPFGLLLTLFLVFGLTASGCAQEPRLLARGDGDIPLHFAITNQDFDRPHVHLTILLNGEELIEGDFDVDDQHRLYEFTVAVDEGAHELAVVSEHDEEFTASIRVPYERWVWISYWGASPEGTFNVRVQDHPVYID